MMAFGRYQQYDSGGISSMMYTTRCTTKLCLEGFAPDPSYPTTYKIDRRSLWAQSTRHGVSLKLHCIEQDAAIGL